MIKVFIDTNIWIRYLVADDKIKHKACLALVNHSEEGKIRSYTSTIVMLELAYTLRSFYHISQKQMMADIKTILSGRNMTLIEKTKLPESLRLWNKYKIKLADCLIARQLPKDAILCTYDRDFKKIKELNSLTPEEIITRIPPNDNS